MGAPPVESGAGSDPRGGARVEGAAAGVPVLVEPIGIAPEPESSDDRFRQLFESSAKGVVCNRPDGRVTAANAAAARILAQLGQGTGDLDFGGVRWGAVRSDGTPVPGDKHPAVIALRTGREVLGETVGVHDPEEGGLLWIRVSAVPLFRRGDREPYEVCTTLEDVTAHARRQEQEYLSRKLDAVGRLAGGMAHDINNLLSVIQGNTDLLLMDAPQGESLHDDLTEIRRACDRAAVLTQQLLALGRRQVLHPRTVDLNARLRDLEPRVRGELGNDVQVVVHLADDAGAVRVDPVQIEEVVRQLAANARDAMPEGGVLTLSTRPREISVEEARAYPYAVVPGPYSEIVVADTGRGIAADVLPNIFEPFFTTKTRARGAGLGLATVYGIVKQSAGYIWVESAPGEGSRFRVCLPRAPGAGEPAPASDARSLGRGVPETVLVVEDEAAVRAVAKRILERGGYHVLEAGDASAALDLSRAYRGPIHLVLSDVVMPGLSGREMVDLLQPLRPETRILYMSGYSDEHLTSYGVTGEALDLIGKPFRPAALLQKVRSVLRRA